MSAPADQIPTGRTSPAGAVTARLVLSAACLLIVAVYAAMAGLKGIGTDEGFRLGIINGGRVFTAGEPATQATWGDVLKANNPYAYQPLYFLVQNSVMRVGRTHDELVLKYVNVFFLWLSLQGLLALSRGWALVPRLFLLGVFGLNAYLFMHVLQLREYVVGIAFYIWSTWMALHLDRRPLGRNGADVGWFSAYGVLLALGYFTQSWAVFPACAQGLYLVVRRAGDRLRFYTHLALSYVVVVCLTWPYLQSHRQKVDIGRWGSDDTRLWPWLGDGFHLVLTGHSFRQLPGTEFFLTCWVLVLATGLALFAWRNRPSAVNRFPEADRQQGLLMVLSLGVAVAFQIAYFLKVDTLSVWPRYFALHYFFLIWLVALGFKTIYDQAGVEGLSRPVRLGWQFAAGTVFAVMVASGVFQVRSYRQNPYFDSGLSPAGNWRALSAALVRLLRPDDVVLTQDFLHAWTLTFTRPLPNPVLPLKNLTPGPYARVDRFVYLESDSHLSARSEVVARLASLGFGIVQVTELRAADAAESVPGWHVLIFQRR